MQADLQAIEDGGLAGTVEPQDEDAQLLLSPEPREQLREERPCNVSDTM